MTRVSARLRIAVVARAAGCCEYCQTSQAIVIKMEVDHIVPQSAGGSTSLENLCLSCITCNDFKLDHQTGVDPDTGEEVALFNPRTQQWSEHFQWDDTLAVVLGKTPLARATITRLRMNDPMVV